MVKLLSCLQAEKDALEVISFFKQQRADLEKELRDAHEQVNFVPTLLLEQKRLIGRCAREIHLSTHQNPFSSTFCARPPLEFPIDKAYAFSRNCVLSSACGHTDMTNPFISNSFNQCVCVCLCVRVCV